MNLFVAREKEKEKSRGDAGQPADRRVHVRDVSSLTDTYGESGQLVAACTNRAN